MNWFKKPKESSSKGQQPQNNIIHDALNNLKTQFSNINLGIPQFSIPNPLSKKDHLSLSDAEIMNRMIGIPIYTLSDSSLHEFQVCSYGGDRSVEFTFFSKADAEDFGQNVVFKTNDDFPNNNFPIIVQDVDLSNVLTLSERNENHSHMRLVPELSQVKNALKERKKDIGADFLDYDEPFFGVPIFQSDDLILKRNTIKPYQYRPAFFKKEDLEEALAREKGSQHKSTIQVAAFEDIIQEMKDDSTSKSNDVVFMAPGWTKFPEHSITYYE